jgi:hypothetical protein
MEESVMKHRGLLATIAVIIFLGFNVATYWWVNSFDSVGAAISLTWKAIINNWMIVIIITDSFCFVLLTFVWLLADARQRGWSGVRRWGWIAAILAFGSPALMIYLVSRPERVSGIPNN